MQLVNDLSAKISNYEPQIRSAIDRVINNGRFILGSEVKKFEHIFSTYLGINHCISMANGTDALELALKACGIRAGHYVATVANAGMYATTALSAVGAQPFFMDVDPNTHLVTLDEVRKAIKNKVTAVIVTHLYGLAVPEIKEIASYCKQQGVFLLEDCAQAHGAQIKSQHVGTFGNVASFSFYPTKNLGALGDGGAVATQDDTIAEKLQQLRQYGWCTKYQTAIPNGRNSRMDELQAAILFDLLPYLNSWNERRRAIATRYSELIKHPLIKVPAFHEENYVAHLYVICCSQRNRLKEYLSSMNILTEIHYPIPDHRQPLFGKHFDHILLPHTERLMSEILTLPCYPEMTDAQVNHVIHAINSWTL